MENLHGGGLSSGHYFRGADGLPAAGASVATTHTEAFTDALADYVERCRKLGVDPMPPKEIQDVPAGKDGTRGV